MTYTFSLGYNFHYKNPFSTYGENIFLMMQGIIILCLIKKYNKRLSVYTFWFSQLLYGAFCAVLFLDLIPEEILEFSIVINIIFSTKIKFLMSLYFDRLFRESPSNFLELSK